jgi:2-keto-4-pentenoate hydratase/2-oxohepta-3-ene-1,7-dioic acid hydratase in catechol pathway
MRLASIRHGAGMTYGVVRDEGIQIVSERFRVRYPSLKAVIAAGVSIDALRESLTAGVLPHETVEFEPPVPNPGKIFCVGMNYQAHVKEMGRKPPEHPAIFVRFPDSLVGHRQHLVRPRVSAKFDYEGEFAVIIGRTARHVRADAALEFIAGYCCFMDGSVRDYQRHTTQFTAGKNFYRSGASGPWLVTTDEIPDPRLLNLETRVNDEVMQHGNIGDLCRGIGELVEYLSAICPLNPGDVIATGTPGGVGFARDPQRWLKPGDRVEVAIDQIGCLENSVIDEIN